MFDYERTKQEMLLALQNEIGYVWYCDHTMNNSFFDVELEKTIRNISIDYVPIGFCLNPEYSPESGVGFVLQRQEDGIEFWFHVSKYCYKNWLKESKQLMENINE